MASTDTRKTLHEAVDALAGVRVVVVGDLVADRYVFGRPYRLSREAPVVVARHEGEKLTPGGAANVLANLAALGASPVALGRVGADPRGEALLRNLKRRGVDVSGVQQRGATVTLTRILVGDVNTRKQQILRLDQFDDPDPAAGEEALDLEDLPEGAAGWIASDYGYGTVTPAVVKALRRRAAAGEPVLGDARRDLGRFRGFTLVKPNQAEAEELLTDLQITGADPATRGAAEIRQRLGAESVLVTRGNQGMVLSTRAGTSPLILPAVGAEEVVDVSGAGDTVAAVMIAAAAAGCDQGVAAALANRGAGVVVMQAGTAVLTGQALHGAIDEGGPEEREPDYAALRRWWRGPRPDTPAGGPT